jgi:DNA gyrase inhibitor GyrI
MKIWIVVLVLGLFAVPLVLVGCQTTRAGYESAPYEVVRKEGRFEVRDYPAITVVETVMTDSDDGFNRLFRFISGQNEGEQKISMTTPVFMAGGESGRTMAFVLPASISLDQAPRPNDDRVRVRELPAGRFVVFCFSGGRRAALEAETLETLEAWMKEEDLEILSTPIYGYFDPPWIPGFLRRNEVMLQTRADS